MPETKIKPMLALVLESYINVKTEKELLAWVKKQPSGEGRKIQFINDCCLVMKGYHLDVIGQMFGTKVERYRYEEDCKDYIDSMRRGYER